MVGGGGGGEISKEPTNPTNWISSVGCCWGGCSQQSGAGGGAEKCTAAIQYLLEVWSRSTAALESGKLWAEDKIIWFMMARYKVTAREVETMAGAGSTAALMQCSPPRVKQV